MSSVAWGAGVPLALALTLPVPPVFAVGSALYPWLFFRIFRDQVDLGRTYRQALTYGTACTVGKIPEALGVGRFWLGRLGRHPSRIMEYKEPAG